ncbi:MAG: hypothetical protein A2233_03135 [Candidatus Kerfeldbacteria bacterium RIFOXYA2_FULL_38_24]|uniref:Nucleotidyl transferase AbiEii/AbiGii toxin family protein n=1 Tax=Candidatus Kerfeldbacteria bacterium RIFOXYB2_FULL_38_14 TaxID=1798547 RepID=A0A1G2BD43_9BACT|nr:MAG: hypothetical protein A2233_03135 [Candidatus Kerfeldbacteria bacterium RIFOXYA2_FULL_38_24]OGY86190.1 MAG: hypothetical protein A2319_03335 [Candidatus Kerfeldbacteria bacterium RIFOXYB2_FULL_38_14]
MESIKDDLKNIIRDSATKNINYQKNLLKRYLQILILDFLYSHKTYSALFFYGGTCLAHCYGLPRLSEDLDFVDVKKNIQLSDLEKDIQKFFAAQTDLKIKTKLQKFRLYIKFPILKELGLASNDESDLLFVKIEIFKGFDFCKKYTEEFMPLFLYNHSILVRTFDLATLMATKIRAVLNRRWEKTNKSGKILIAVKGRDYFDLMWYLQQKVKPNLQCIEQCNNLANLKKILLTAVENVDAKSIQLDLEAFIDEHAFVKNTSKNIIAILKREINNL